MDRKSVLTNLKAHDGLWGCKNYPLTQEEAEVIIEALEGQEPHKVDEIVKFNWASGDKVLGGRCACGTPVMRTDKYCRQCGKPLDWGDR